MAPAPQTTPTARTDRLTGLDGREGVLAALDSWLARGTHVHALLLGLRRFDAINRVHGSPAGDAVLIELACRIQALAKADPHGNWLIARIAGHEFLLVSDRACSREQWQLSAGELLDSLALPQDTPWGTLRLSPRGALIRSTANESARDLLGRLEQGLEVALKQPTRRMVWSDDEAGRLGVGDLVQALERGEIEVVYQPQFACRDDRLTGAEALARWNHPQMGQIGAASLFAIAERGDLVGRLTETIARQAVTDAGYWPMDMRLSLNLTPTDLAAPDFAGRFTGLVEECGFAPWRLTLEVTEQVLLADIADASQVLELLAGKGMRIALDDFGAGFCNFRYLKMLPLHSLKLDRSMLDGITTDPRDLAVLRAVVAMAGALDLKVVAEGVESEAQRLVVQQEGCSSYQGLLRAQPMDAQAFLMLARG